MTATGQAGRLEELAAEQAALRRVATLAARRASPRALFEAVAEEVGRLFPVGSATIGRFEPDATVTTVASWSATEVAFPTGSRWPTEGTNVVWSVLQTGQAARVDDFSAATDPIGVASREAGMKSAVGSPIVVEGDLWGVITATSTEGAMPPGSETRLASFTELVAAAIANAESRNALEQLAEEQLALRRVATLVARGITPERVFQAVAAEVGVLFDSDVGAIVRFEDERTVRVLGAVGGPHEADKRVTLDPGYVVDVVRQTSASARFDTDDPAAADMPSLVRALGIRSAVASPIVVQGDLWGAITIASVDGPLPHGAERRLTEFTDLVATAVANTQARKELTLLADEQAALRRVAMLVARESGPTTIFSAVTEEARRVLDCEAVGLLRFEPDDTATLVAQSDTPWDPPPLGTPFTLDGENLVVEVFRTGEAARVDDWSSSSGSVAGMATVLGVRSAVASPVVVEGRLWGTIVAATSRSEPLRPETESRIAQFTGLVATAIANAEARRELSQLADEQAALRRVATLVAQRPSPEEIFTAVSEAVGSVLGADVTAIVVFHDEVAGAVVASWSCDGPEVPVGTPIPLDIDTATAHIFHSAAAAWIDAYPPGPGAEAARSVGVRSTVGAPILVEGKLWGAVVAAVRGDRPLPDDAEQRITAFTELVATAISDAEAHRNLQRLADEQAALRRVAELVAKESALADVLLGVAEELAKVLGDVEWALARDDGDGMATVLAVSDHNPTPAGTRVPINAQTAFGRAITERRPARIDDYFATAGEFAQIAREHGIRAAVSYPIVVRGRTWGAMSVGRRNPDPFPPETETVVARFSELVATAIANAEARAQVERLADEQAALRRIATLVAGGAVPEQVFAAVTEEIAATFDAITAVMRYEHDPPGKVMVGLSEEGGIPIGTRWPTLEEGVLSTEVYRTGRSARFGAVEQTHRRPVAGFRGGVPSQVACPIIVGGRLWGVITLNAARELPPDTEQRLEKFIELVTTAIANAEAGIALRAAAEEQAALRRVATLVAASAAPSDVFAAVISEIALVLGADACMLCRADPDGAAVVVGTWADGSPEPDIGARIPRGGTNLITIVLDSGRPARMDSYGEATGSASEVARAHRLRSAVGAPIHVEGRRWGLVIAGTTRDQPLPPDAEERLAGFTELVATAIANTDSREALASLADEQAALRRIATLVARGVEAEQVFAAVTDETAATFDAITTVMRFVHDPPGNVIVGVSKETGIPIGTRWPFVEGMTSAEVYRTGRSARLGAVDWASHPGPVAEAGLRFGVTSQVACPIVVEGTLWGVVTLNASEELPPDTEQRLEKFTELITTAIANAESRSELADSRRRIVAAADDARRRIQRDLHDGTQQRLVSLGLAVRAVEASVPSERSDLRGELSRVVNGLADAVEELQELSRGIHPAILARGGLGAALETLALRSATPVELDLTTDSRLPEPIEVSAYFVASEALANAAKHAHASRIQVSLGLRDGSLLLCVRDDGVGGADSAHGSGLVGLKDRVEALGGTITVESPCGGGTSVAVALPLEAAAITR